MSTNPTIHDEREHGLVFRQLLDSHPTPMLIASKGEAYFTLVNQAAIRLLNLAPDQRNRLSLSSFYSVMGGSPLALDELTGGIAAVPAWFRSDANADQLVELLASPIVFEATAAVLVILNAKCGEVHLQYDENTFLRSVLEDLPVGVFVKDMHDGGRYVLFNRMSGEIAGIDPNDIIGALDRSSRFAALADQFHKEDVQVLREAGAMIVSEAAIQPDGSKRVVRTVKCALRPADGLPARFVLGISYDITESRALETRLAHLALHDSLTGLANRDLFMETLQKLVVTAVDQPIVLFCLDIDHFKSINDRLGHQSGDEVLREVGRRLTDFAGPSGIAARVGGDEFTIAIPQPVKISLQELAGQLYGATAEPVVLNNVGEPIAVSIGVVRADTPCELTYLEKSADLALYAAKKEGRARYRLYDPSMRAEFDHRENLIAELRRAVGSREFVWYYQPIVNLTQNRIVAFEALLRWQHPSRGLLAPGEFIEIAEQSGQICTIGEMMFKQAFRTAANWPDNIRLSINLSVKQLENATLLTALEGALLAAGLPPDRVEVEVTESIFLSEHAVALTTLENLKAIGVTIAIDDFGRGYSSLSYLSAFPFDKIKLDQAFVSGLEARFENDAIITAVAGIAKGFGLISTAEGVETTEQRDRLASVGFDEAQGYLISPPVPEHGTSYLIERYR